MLSLAAALFVVPLVLAAFVRVPYYLVAPGEARGVAQLINIKSGSPAFEPKGQILFTTVSLTGNVNVYRALRAWLDDDVEVVPEERITGGAPKKEVRRLNIQAMDDSKLTAIKVALERLEYRVEVEGHGAQVIQVVVGEPADGRLAPGDVILAIDGEEVFLHDQAVTKVRQHRAGDRIDIRVRHSNGTEEIVQIKAADGGEGQARVGVVLQTFELAYRFPVDVSIDTGLVGGPSAGLAFTLALLDELTPGELTGGRNVAVTGTIDGQGKVGAVGGVAQKAVTARKAGAAVFLVPPEELSEAKAHAGKMRVVSVSSLDEAEAALRELGGSGIALPTATPSPSS